MTRTLLLLVALYVVWRVATIFGRLREREVRSRQRRFGVEPLVRCGRCGAFLPEERVAYVGWWPLRRPVCRDGCHGGDGGHGHLA